MKAAIGGLVSGALTSRTLRGAARAASASARRISGARPHVHYFHDVADPYAHLSAQLLARLVRDFDVDCSAHLVPRPDEGAAPEREMLAAYSLRDAPLLAAATGLTFPANARAPATVAISAIESALAGVKDAGAFAAQAAALGDTLWGGASIAAAATGDPAAALAEGAALREKLGHYLGGAFAFEGEWYWGPDRFAYLEERLEFARKTGEPFVHLHEDAVQSADARGATLDYFLSPRSPYTYLAAARVRKLAERMNATLRYRCVRVRVMRGWPAPSGKRFYIVRDAKREADRNGMEFGRVADPVGPGAERGLAVLHHALREGRGGAFAESFLQGVFSEAIDSATDAGLWKLAERAGVSRATVEAALNDESWRDIAEANREEMFALGVWGVPSFRVAGRAAHWGQDRLWAVAQDLRDIANSGASA